MGSGTEGILSVELTNEHDPTVSDPAYQAPVPEALDEESKCEASPSADEIP
jgi:hypothetical protein